MLLVGITFLLILIGIGFFAYGAIALSKYAFRVGTGPGLLTLLFPPYTIYFGVFKLEEEGKSWPMASWVFGIVVAVLLTVVFWGDLSAVMSGNTARFEGSSSVAESAAVNSGQKPTQPDSSSGADESTEAAKSAPADDGDEDKAKAKPTDPDGTAKDGDQAAGQDDSAGETDGDENGSDGPSNP